MNNSITTPKYAQLSAELDAIAKVNLLNPLGQELSQMRTSLLFSLMEVVAYNQNRQQRDLKMYEMGKVYQKVEDGHQEDKKIALAICGRANSEAWNTDDSANDIFRLKGAVQTLLASLGINGCKEEASERDIFATGLSFKLGKQVVAEVGIVHPSIQKAFAVEQEVVYAELDFERLYNLAFKKDIKVQPIPKFPSSRRDFALLVDENVSFDDLKATAQKVERKILTHINLFDVYEGKNLPAGKKSYGLSFHFSDPNKTLTDKYIDKIMAKLKASFEKDFGASLR